MKQFLLTILFFTPTSYAVQVGDIADYFNNGGWVIDFDENTDKSYLDTVRDFGGVTYSLGYIETAPDSYRYFIQSHTSIGQTNTAFGNGLSYVFLATALNNFTGELTGNLTYTNEQTLMVAIGMGDFVQIIHLDQGGNVYDNAQLNYVDLVNQHNGPLLVRDILYIPDHNNFPKSVVITEVEWNNLGETDFGAALYDMNPNNDIAYNAAFGSSGRVMCFHDHTSNPNFLYSPDSPASVVYLSQNESVIIGGTAYENEGRNQAFCEFNMNNGQLLSKWSTQGQFFFESNQEWVSSMVLDESSASPLLYAGGSITGDGELDFVIFRYKKDIMNQWQVDSSFGTGGFRSITFGIPNSFLPALDVGSHLLKQENGHLLIGGTSYWDSGTTELSHINLAQINEAGDILNNWGQQFGRIGLIWKDSPFDEFPKEQLNGMFLSAAEDIVVSGTLTGQTNQELRKIGGLARLYNDPLFKSNFD